MLTGHEPVAEFAAGLAAIRQHPMAAERFPEMDTKTLRALFGREINACYKITGNFALFFESIAKSPWLLANGKLDKLLQPSTYRAVCAGKYLPKGKSGNQVASDEDLLALDYQNELESLEDMEDFNE